DKLARARILKIWTLFPDESERHAIGPSAKFQRFRDVDLDGLYACLVEHLNRLFWSLRNNYFARLQRERVGGDVTHFFIWNVDDAHTLTFYIFECVVGKNWRITKSELVGHHRKANVEVGFENRRKLDGDDFLYATLFEYPLELPKPIHVAAVTDTKQTMMRIEPVDAAFPDASSGDRVKDRHPYLYHLAHPDRFLAALPRQSATANDATVAQHQWWWISSTTVWQVDAGHAIGKIGINDFYPVILKHLGV